MTNLDPAGFAVYFDLMFSVVLQSVKSQKMSLFPLLMLLTSKEKHLYKKVIITNTNNYSFELVKIDCKTVGFFLKISKEIGKAWRTSLTRVKRASLTRCVLSLVPDLWFDCSRLLEYAKIRTVLQSIVKIASCILTRN